jgi:hypothetical protein
MSKKIMGRKNATFYIDKDGSIKPFGVLLVDSMNRMRAFYKRQRQKYNIVRLQWQKSGLVK